MAMNNQKTFLCLICQEKKPLSQGIQGELIHSPMVELIQKKYPSWSQQDFVCIPCVNRMRAEYIQDVLEVEKGELSAIEMEVIRSVKEQELLLSKNINVEFDRQLTFGERIADKVAEFGGSWRFIIIFGVVLLLWIAINSLVLLIKPFDPYPFIFLNLILSCLAAIQAPIIMMSQNRQETRDRLRAENDYRINLKAELEIRHLHAKIDQLLTHQWQRLLEIQQIQTELMEEVKDLLRKKRQGHGG